MFAVRTLSVAAALAAIIALDPFAVQSAQLPAPPAPPPAATAPAAPNANAARPNVAGATAAPAPTAPAAPAAQAPKEKVYINDPKATVADFDKLFGVGDKFAAAINSARAKQPFSDAADVTQRSGLPKGVVDGFWAQVLLADVNNACYEDLKAALNGVGVVSARSIVENRAKTGYKNVDDLAARTGIPAATLKKLEPQLLFGKFEPSKPWGCLSD